MISSPELFAAFFAAFFLAAIVPPRWRAERARIVFGLFLRGGSEAHHTASPRRSKARNADLGGLGAETGPISTAPPRATKRVSERRHPEAGARDARDQLAHLGRLVTERRLVHRGRHRLALDGIEAAAVGTTRTGRARSGSAASGPAGAGPAWVQPLEDARDRPAVAVAGADLEQRDPAAAPGPGQQV